MINIKAYAYGNKVSKKFAPALQSIHEYFPKHLRELFDDAFINRIRPTARDWTNVLKNYADPSKGKLIKCDIVPNEHAHFGLGCGFCALLIKNKKTKSQPKKGVRQKLIIYQV